MGKKGGKYVRGREVCRKLMASLVNYPESPEFSLQNVRGMAWGYCQEIPTKY